MQKFIFYKSEPIKNLTYALVRTGGRNNLGRITFFHRGGGHKRKYRLIDFVRNYDEASATVRRLEYDPFRSCFIALVAYDNGFLSYILAWNGLYIGARIGSGLFGKLRLGHAHAFYHMKKGVAAFNLGLNPGCAGIFARSAGTSAIFLKEYNTHVVFKLPSSEHRAFYKDRRGVLGVAANSKHREIIYMKAGNRRHLGFRPVVRGVAMNPIDHPHGGGEGKASPKVCAVSPWGLPTKGTRTRSLKLVNKFIIARRKKKKIIIYV